ncbi:hypothetical protein KFZ76_20070 [Methylovulum psychrotolerans]|uniref:hypothetical protein n=1 Tax=Methylovulum psychrotolerans TaxID=1704499 RepID=UPI001BFF1253|nr:hypothetical protein [Methylovulum psychrotolerans]MBT9100001.1 hypothetical protein [Methylovulum psychrotolerans]
MSVALQSDGKILLAGRAASGTNSYNFGLVRLNTDGSLDTAFGNGGKVTTDMGSANDAAFSTLVQSDGKIVLAGHSGLARYNSNGSLDNTFSGDGKLATSYSISGAVSVWGGKLVAAGGNTIDRYKADGSLDTTFSGDGKAQVGFTAAGVTVQADGKILVTGSGPTFGGALSGNDHDFYTARYNANGSLDTTFNATFNTVGTAVVAQEGGATPTAIAPHALIQDAELDALNGGLGNYSGASLTLARHGGANAQDVLGVSGTLALSNGSVVLGGTVVGTYQQSPGQLTLLFGTATSAQVNSVLHQLTYTNSSQAAPTAIQLAWTFNDGDPTHPLATTAATPITIMASNSHADGHVWINGNHAAGQTLTASNDLTDPDGMAANTVFTYQWQGSSNGTTWSNLGSGANLVVTPATANNTLSGGNGNDLLAGSLGNDTLTGGLGQDTFAFNSALGAGNIDTITDFNVANDTIRLSKGIFTTLTSGVLAAEAFKILGNGGVEDGSDHLLYNTATGALSYDADGSGTGAAVQIAILGTGLAMTNADFMVA